MSVSPSADIKTKTGKRPSEITLEAVRRGDVTAEDIQISRATLLRQRDVALAHHRPQLAGNFERGAELTDVPDGVILEMYEKLRPYRATGDELRALARELREKYRAPKCAALVEDAAEAYAKAGLFRP